MSPLATVFRALFWKQNEIEIETKIKAWGRIHERVDRTETSTYDWAIVQYGKIKEYGAKFK